MDEKYVIYREELTHHGVKGQKWGIRRFQNKDGSLTADGKKRRSLGETVHNYRVAKKRKANLKKARETRAANKAAAEQRAKDLKAGKIKPKDMTDAELKARLDRLNLEKQYRDAVKNENQSKLGKRFTNKFSESLVDKLADNVGADLVNQVVKSFGSKGLNAVFDPILGETTTYANNKKKS